MAPSQATEDYYKFLGIPQSAGKDAIRASYRNLALKYHPDRNPNNPQATAQFQLLEAAYSTLSDPERRRIYDLQYDSIKRNSATSNKSKDPPPPQANSNTSDQIYKILIAKLEAAIQQLRNREDELAGQLAKVRNECNKSKAALDRLKAEADVDAKEEANRNSWYGYFFSRKQSEEEMQVRQRRMVDNRAARTVREAELKRLMTRVATTQSLLEDIERRTREKVNEKHRLQIHEMNRQEAIRLAELRRQQAAQKEREERSRPSDCERHKRLNAYGGKKRLNAYGGKKRLKYEGHKKPREYEEHKEHKKPQDTKTSWKTSYESSRDDFLKHQKEGNLPVCTGPGGARRRDGTNANDLWKRHAVLRFAARAVIWSPVLGVVTS